MAVTLINFCTLLFNAGDRRWWQQIIAILYFFSRILGRFNFASGQLELRRLGRTAHVSHFRDLDFSTTGLTPAVSGL
jgi:hypothetical protein